MASTTMQLEFEQAMTDFKTMFPDMDVDVIEAILRSNKGAVDATIDQLLAMSTDNQNEKLRNELDHSRGGGAGDANKRSTISHNSSSPVKASQNRSHSDQQSFREEQSLVSLSPVLGSRMAVAASPKSNGTSNSSRWKPPLLSPLPPTFLRINGTGPGGSRIGSATGGSGLEQDLPDEQLALMLQNEEFMNELRWNQEFMLALEKEQAGHKAKGDDDAAFRDRVKNMGKMSRKKFQQLAKKFTWQKNKKMGAVRHPDSLLLQEEHSDDDEPRRGAAKK